MTWREFVSFPKQPRPWLIWSCFLVAVVANVNGALEGASFPLRLLSVTILTGFVLMYFWFWQLAMKRGDHWFDLYRKELGHCRDLLSLAVQQQTLLEGDGEEWKREPE